MKRKKERKKNQLSFVTTSQAASFITLNEQPNKKKTKVTTNPLFDPFCVLTTTTSIL
uniref:Uncharacterized protein n=1 Tax=Lepeophtheirus salmonis TaxID=72036 RepID=A0A0K2UAR1_LEPSM